MALDALFSVPPAQDAIYTPYGGTARQDPIRIIVGKPDEEVTFGESRIINAEIAIEIRMSEVAEPGDGDLLETANARYCLRGEPQSDLEGVTWRIGAQAVPRAV